MVNSGPGLVSDPRHTTFETLAASPAAIPAVPSKEGVASPVDESAAGEPSVGTGAAGSTEDDRGALRPVLPAASRCAATAVYGPSASAEVPVTEKAPSTSATAGRDCSGALSVSDPDQISTVTLGASPDAVPAVPVKVGVPVPRNVPSAGVLSPGVGGATSLLSITSWGAVAAPPSRLAMASAVELLDESPKLTAPLLPTAGVTSVDVQVAARGDGIVPSAGPSAGALAAVIVRSPHVVSLTRDTSTPAPLRRLLVGLRRRVARLVPGTQP